MRKNLLVGWILGCLMVFVAQPAFAQAQSASLVGSWELSLTPSSGTVAVAGLANFTSDGGAIATAAGILVGPVAPGSTSTTPLNPAFGNWNGSGPIGTGAAFKFVSLVTNADGSIAATRTFQATVTVNANGNGFTGTYTVETVEGTVVIHGTGSISGSLIPHFLPPA